MLVMTSNSPLVLTTFQKRFMHRYALGISFFHFPQSLILYEKKNYVGGVAYVALKYTVGQPTDIRSNGFCDFSEVQLHFKLL